MRVEEARRAVAREVDAVRSDLERSFLGRSLRPGIGLLLIAGAAAGFWWGERRLTAARQSAGALDAARRKS
jgi:hypothetical protein